MNMDVAESLTHEQRLKARYALARQRTFDAAKRLGIKPDPSIARKAAVDDIEPSQPTDAAEVVIPVKRVVKPKPKVKRPIPRGFHTRCHLRVLYRDDFIPSAGSTSTAPYRTMDDIAADVLNQFRGVTVKDVKGTSRKQRLILPRRLTFHAIRRETGKSYLEIARWGGGRDHSTIIYLCQWVEREQASGTLNEKIAEWRLRY